MFPSFALLETRCVASVHFAPAFNTWTLVITFLVDSRPSCATKVIQNKFSDIKDAPNGVESVRSDAAESF